MTPFRPLPGALSRPLSVAVLAAWVLQMGVLLSREYLQALPVALSGDLSRYGSGAQWKGVYYRGEKIGFMVSQTVAKDDGYELVEEGRLQMNLLGATTAAKVKTVGRVDRAFALRGFSFALDPGTGAIQVDGALEGRRLTLKVKTTSGERTDVRDLPEAPLLSMSLPRQLAARGLAPGQILDVPLFDPATLRNAPMRVEVKAREVVEANGRPVPAFRVETRFSGVTSTSWITDVGEVVREESPMGLVVVRETPDRAQALAVPGKVQTDMLEAAAIVPKPMRRIDDPRAVLRLRVRLEGIEAFEGPDLQGAGQTVEAGVFEIRDARTLAPGPRDPEADRFLAPEPFLESDAPEIVAEARRATEGVATPRARAERLVRHVNALLQKKPTVSLPSALEVLRTRVGDCNEHTALYVALARAAGIPARVAVGLVHIQGAFYYHAWAETYVDEGRGRGLWLPADPTLNQFPADATHVRLARGGLEKQAAILGLVGRATMAVLDLEERPGATPVLVGRPAAERAPLEISLPRRDGTGRTCWSSPGR